MFYICIYININAHIHMHMNTHRRRVYRFRLIGYILYSSTQHDLVNFSFFKFLPMYTDRCTNNFEADNPQ